MQAMERYFEINENGHNIRCKLYCSNLREIRKIVVFGHGFGGHKDNGAAKTFAERMVSGIGGTYHLLRVILNGGMK